MQRLPSVEIDYKNYIHDLIVRTTSLIGHTSSSQLKSDYEPIRYRMSQIHTVANSHVTEKVNHKKMLEVIEEMDNLIYARTKAPATNPFTGAAAISAPDDLFIPPAELGLQDVPLDETRPRPAPKENKPSPETIAKLKTLKEELIQHFINFKKEATLLVLLSSCARLLETLLIYRPELKTIVKEIDVFVEQQNQNLEEKIGASFTTLHERDGELLGFYEWTKVSDALKSNAYLSVDIADSMSWLDKGIDYAKRSMTLNPVKHVISNPMYGISDIDIDLTGKSGDAIVAPYSTSLHVPYLDMRLGVKEDLAVVNSEMNLSKFSPIYDPELKRQVYRYRLPRESLGHTNESVNFFTVVLTRGNEDEEEISTQETHFTHFGHGNCDTAANQILAMDDYVLNYMKNNPHVKKVVATVGDYIGSAATKGTPLSIYEIANDSILLGVKHWIRVSGRLGNHSVIGQSLGGVMTAIAMDQLKLPVLYFNVDSLAYPGKFATELLREFGSKKIPQFVGTALVELFASKYSVDPVKHFENLSEEYRYVICKFEDSVIPYAASMFANLTKNIEMIKSRPDIQRLIDKFEENKAKIAAYTNPKIPADKKPFKTIEGTIEKFNLCVEQRVEKFNLGVEQRELCNSIVESINGSGLSEGFLLDASNHNGPQTKTIAMVLDTAYEYRNKWLVQNDLKLFNKMNQYMEDFIKPGRWSLSKPDPAIQKFAEIYREFVEKLNDTLFNIEFAHGRVLIGFLYEASINPAIPTSIQAHIKKFFAKGEDLGYVKLIPEFAAQCAANDFIRYHEKREPAPAPARP